MLLLWGIKRNARLKNKEMRVIKELTKLIITTILFPLIIVVAIFIVFFAGHVAFWNTIDKSFNK